MASRTRRSTSSSARTPRTPASRPIPASPSAVEWVAIDRVRELVREGNILDGMSLTGILYALSFGGLTDARP